MKRIWFHNRSIGLLGCVALSVAAATAQTVRPPGKIKEKTAAAPQKALAKADSGPTQPSKVPGAQIDRFGKMDERFYRGEQPDEEDFVALKALGIQTVIDLRNDPRPFEKAKVEELGMRYVNIPMSDSAYPKEESIVEFLRLANDSRTGVFFVHCNGGRHRTGVVGAVYRMTKYGWSFDQAYEEMKNYDFYTRWGHGAMKDYVVDYAARLSSRK